MIRRLSRVLIGVVVLVATYGVAEGASAPQAAAVVGPTTARTAAPPTMGWATWNWFGDRFDANTIKQQADAMVSSGMKAAGYDTIGIDEGWWDGTRDANGNITVRADQWPGGMKAIADYIHAKGLKAGIYTDAGPYGCGTTGPRYKPSLPGQGSYGHYDQDFLQFSRWGYDFVKVDWCGGFSEGMDPKTQYTQVSQAIQRATAVTGRPMTLNICNWGRNNPWEWGPGISDSWRAGGDIGPGAAQDPNPVGGGGATITLDRVLDVFDGALHPLAQHTGFSNDADMMMIGFPALSDEDNRTHLSLWAMNGGPLRAGNNLASMSSATVATLTNRDVIAVDQDAAGLQATLVADDGRGHQVYSKVLAGSGKRAVLLLNRGTDPAPITARWTDLGLGSGSASVKNLWSKQTSSATGSVSATVPGRDMVMLTVSGTEGATVTTQGESATLSGSAVKLACSACEGGYDVGYLGTNGGNSGYLTFNGLTASRNGYAQLTVRYANGDAITRYFTMTVNGQDPTVLAFPPTGNWGTVGAVTALISVRKGSANSMRLENPTAYGPDVDSIKIGVPVSVNAGAPTGRIVGPGGKCVDVAGANTANGTAVQLYDCNGNAAQEWTLRPDGSVTALGKCLDIPGGQTANGTQLWLWDCVGGDNQKWQPVSGGGLRNPLTGRCLDSPGGSTATGTRLQIWDCLGNSAQKFVLPT